MKKFWTVQDGKVGTAHTSRDGRTVDFRPATDPPQAEESYGRKFIVIQPPRDVRGCEELRLELGPDCSERVVTDKDRFTKGQQSIKEIYRTRFIGVELIAGRHLGSEWYDKEEEAAERVRNDERHKEWQAEHDAQKQFLESFPRQKFWEKATRRNVGRLQAGRHIIQNVLINILRAEAEQAGFVDPSFVDSHVWRLDNEELEEIQNKILEYSETMRTERKQQWLTKSWAEGGKNADRS